MLVSAAVAGAAALAVVLWPSGSQARAAGEPTAVVTRGPMVVMLTKKGELRAERRTVISNALRWPVIIKQVVDEGTLVREGDTIIQFECKELNDAVIREQLDVTSAQNSHTQAEENLELRRKEMANKIRKAEQAIIDAEEDQKRYVEGDWPVKENQAESAIHLAQRDLTLAEAKWEFKVKTNKREDLNSPYSAREIEADKLSVDRLKLALERARSDKMILEKYTHPRELRKLKMGVEDSELDLERTRLEAKTQLRVAEALEAATKARLDMQTDKLEELRLEESKLLVKAERTGLVVYDTGGSHYRPSEVSVEVGARVTSRQQLMIIPDMSSLQVQLRVYEAVINQVRPGLRAFIRLDSRPDLALTGKVSRVSVLPDDGGRWSPDVNEYRVYVEFDKPVESLNFKPGMMGDVELELARLPDVLTVPVAGVFVHQGRPFCWRVAGGKLERVFVKVARTNQARAEISGLNEGDVVLIAPPLKGQAPSDKEASPDEKGEPGKGPAPGQAGPGPPPRSPGSGQGSGGGRGGTGRGRPR